MPSHRDYTSNASVQVMLFADRLEVWNPGQLPPSLTIADLRKSHASIPHNPLIAEPMFLSTYAEKAGSGILDMFALCREAKLPPPLFRQDGGQFVQTVWRPKMAGGTRGQNTVQTAGQHNGPPDSQPESLEVKVLRLLAAKSLGKAELSAHLGQKEISGQLNKVIRALLAGQTVAPTIPDKPNSRLQKYRLTDKGRKLLKELAP